MRHEKSNKRMKPEKSKHVTRAYSNARSRGDAPDIGRVSRVHGSTRGSDAPLIDGRRRKRKTGVSSRNRIAQNGRRSLVRSTTFVFSVLTLLCVMLTLGVWLVSKRDTLGRPTKLAKEANEERVRVVSKFQSPSELDAIATVKQALAIRTVGPIEDYFRLGTTSREEVLEFLQGLEAENGKVRELKWLSSIDSNGLSVDGVQVSFAREDKRCIRMALLTPDASGKWKIDFDGFARTTKQSWDKFLNKSVTNIQVRAYVAKDMYYNGPFSNEHQWLCYRIVSPDREESLFGYCNIGSVQANALDAILARQAELPRVVLEISQVEGADPRQVMISRVLGEDWILGNVPFEERFK